MYGTKFLSKSLTFAWAWLGTRTFHNVDRAAHHIMLEELSEYIDSGKIKCHLTQRLKLNVDGLRKAHGMIESGKTIGKIALGVDEEGTGEAFC
jgi:NADPH:quinone reductase-like Zn-dependent oxidoreductase